MSRNYVFLALTVCTLLGSCASNQRALDDSSGQLDIGRHFEGIEGTWKVGQNKDAEAVAAASDHIERAAIGMESSDIAMLMQEFLEDRD